MKTSIIICAYNEEKTIEDVVSTIVQLNPDLEVIVVDDGSKDRTPEIVTSLMERLSIVFERLPENKGKSWAMVRGVERATGEIIVFFDADVTHINKSHVHALVQPLSEDMADMVLGQPSDTVIDYRFHPFRSLTGERAVFKKDIKPILEDIRTVRFGVETFLNLYYQANGKRIHYVWLEGLKHPLKYEKVSAFQATKEFISEGREIAETVLKNHNLIIQRVELLMKEANEKARRELDELQEKINEQLKHFRDRFHP